MLAKLIKLARRKFLGQPAMSKQRWWYNDGQFTCKEEVSWPVRCWSEGGKIMDGLINGVLGTGNTYR